MIIKLICTLAFLTPGGHLSKVHDFDMEHYSLEYATANLSFTISSDTYSVTSSTGVCTLSTFKENKNGTTSR